jgi:hypothetical protein
MRAGLGVGLMVAGAGSWAASLMMAATAWGWQGCYPGSRRVWLDERPSPAAPQRVGSQHRAGSADRTVERRHAERCQQRLRLRLRAGLAETVNSMSSG